MLTFNHLRRYAGLAVLVGTLTLLGGCAALQAQNPDSSLRPVNAVADDGQARVMLKGADVVAYFTQNQYRAGSPQFNSVYEGVTFRFASAEHKRLFDASPKQYLPEFGGYCANGIVYGIPWGGDADTWTMIQGKLYIFGGQASKDAFMLKPEANLMLAKQYWSQEVAGSNSFWQRAKRLTFKVPHYQSGDQLAKAVASAKVAK